jgi:2'-5' RNA ligase
MKRLFVAVPVLLSPDFQTLSQKIQEGMSRDQVVWVKPELQHLTLRFLGETPESKIDSLKKILTNITATTPAFDMELDKIGVFGSKYAPTTIWYGFNEFSHFKNLFEQLEPQLQELGFEPNYGNFVPHLTVGRIKKVENKKRFTELITSLQPRFTQKIPVKQLHLIRSKLTTSGPIYTTLGTYRLK